MRLLVLAAAVLLSAAAPSSSAYAGPEDIVADYANAMRRVFSSAPIDVLLAKYFACRSFRDETDDACAAADRHLAGRGRITCTTLRLNGFKLLEAARGKGEVDHCVRAERHWFRLNGVDLEREEAAESCREDLPFRARGDLEGYCQTLVAHADISHADPDYIEDGVVDMPSCRKIFAYLAGEPERCAAAHGDDEYARDECLDNAKFLRALRRKEPGLAAGTYLAPLVDRAAGCGGLGEAAVRSYRARAAQRAAVRSATAAYVSAAALMEDYDRAMSVVVSTDEINFALARYYACTSFQQDSDAVCGAIDGRLRRPDVSSWTCIKHRLGGLRFRELVRGGGSVEHCVRDESLLAEREGESREEAEESCREEAGVYRGEESLRDYCLQVAAHVADGGHEDDTVRSAAGCERLFVYLLGEPEKCAIHASASMRANCVEEAKLIKALRENDARFVAGTVFAPLLDRGASCAALEAQALETYERFRAEYAAIGEAAR